VLQRGSDQERAKELDRSVERDGDEAAARPDQDDGDEDGLTRPGPEEVEEGLEAEARAVRGRDGR